MTQAKGVSNRQIRGAVNRHAAALEQNLPAMHEAINALADNQRMLKGGIDLWAKRVEALEQADAARSQSLWTRLGWIVRGR